MTYVQPHQGEHLEHICQILSIEGRVSAGFARPLSLIDELRSLISKELP